MDRGGEGCGEGGEGGEGFGVCFREGPGGGDEDDEGGVAGADCLDAGAEAGLVVDVVLGVVGLVAWERELG